MKAERGRAFSAVLKDRYIQHRKPVILLAVGQTLRTAPYYSVNIRTFRISFVPRRFAKPHLPV